MPKNLIFLLAVIVIASQLMGCVVYDRPYYGPHYYHGWWYR
jgi:hypothetical protein